MFTIFSCPKDFTGLFGIIQRNAINSWLRLDPLPQILLYGITDKNVKKEFNHKNIIHLPIEHINEYGTPYVSEIFLSAKQKSENQTLCYVNSDIILFNDFTKCINDLKKCNDYFGVGRRYNFEINKIINFKSMNIFENETPFQKKYLDTYTGSDYYIFDRDLLDNFPKFLIGRTCWDNWLIYNAISRGFKVVDCSSRINCVHQKHDYSHIKTDTTNHYKGIEREYNYRLLGSANRIYNLKDCNYLFKEDKLVANLSLDRFINIVIRNFGLLIIREFLSRLKKNYINL